MKKLIALLAALSIIWTAGVPAIAAPLGNPFYVGATSPQELGRIIKCDLDPSRGNNVDGTKIINVKVCGKVGDRAFAAPVDYLGMFQIDDPDAHLTSVAQIPDYLAGLAEMPVPTGKYWSACLKQSTRTVSGWKAYHQCIARSFHKGEKAWGNKVTGRIVLMGDCTNPVSGPEKPDDCVYIYAHIPAQVYRRNIARTVTGLRLKQYGPTDISADVCTGVKRAGEPDYESPFVEECPDRGCNFWAMDNYLGEHGWKTGSYEPAPGLHIFRLPRKMADRLLGYRMVFCLDLSDGTQTEYSSIVTARFYLSAGGRTVATIYVDETTANAVGTKTLDGTPTDLWWHWASEPTQ